MKKNVGGVSGSAKSDWTRVLCALFELFFKRFFSLEGRSDKLLRRSHLLWKQNLTDVPRAALQGPVINANLLIVA